MSRFFRNPFVKKVALPQAFSAPSDSYVSEIVEAVKAYEWVRSVLVSEHSCVAPSVDPYLLAALYNSNGYHSRAIQVKQIVTVGQGYECSDALRACIERPNEDESFHDLLQTFSLDLETYGNAYIEPVYMGYGGWRFHRSPALLTRVKAPPRDHPDWPESFIQFYYERGVSVTSREFEKFGAGLRTGIRQLKLASPTADPWYGLPEYLAAMKCLILNEAIMNLMERWFKNQLSLDKIILLTGVNFTPEVQQSLTNFLRGLRGVENAAKNLLLELPREAKFEIQDMNAGIKDAPYQELRTTNRDEIVSAHGTPPRLLGIIQAGQLGAVGEVEGQLKIFKLNFVDARQLKIESFFQNLFADCGLPDVKSFKLNSLDITAGSLDAQTLAMLVGGQPILTPAEARESWFTEKDVLKPEAAALLLKFASMIVPLVSKL